jgi:hypothetical protein
MMKIDKIIATFSLFSLMTARNFPVHAAAKVENFDVDAAPRNAVTRSDHEGSRRQILDNAAVETQAKAQEQKRLSDQAERSMPDKSFFN